jgi:hypothetical protein
VIARLKMFFRLGPRALFAYVRIVRTLLEARAWRVPRR